MNVLNIAFYVFLAVLAVMVTILNYSIHKSLKSDYKNLRK